MNVLAADPARAAARRWVRLLAAVCLLVAVLAPVAGAFAHASLTSSSPSNGDELQDLPPTVELTFSEAVAAPAYVVVRDPAGNQVDGGEPQVLDAVVTQSLQGRGVAGLYSVEYRVVSADGHPVTGSLAFTVLSGSEVVAEVAGDPKESGSFWARHWEQVALAGVGLLAGVTLLGSGLRGRA